MEQQRVAVVTGGGSGIGLGISRRLASDGHAIAVFDLNGYAAVAAAKDIEAAGGKAVDIQVDVADREQVFAAVAEVRSQHSRPAVLVNNAGMGAVFTRFLKLSPELWEQVLRVNLRGAFNCCQAVLPEMIDPGWGRIVNISSSSARSSFDPM